MPLHWHHRQCFPNGDLLFVSTLINSILQQEPSVFKIWEANQCHPHSASLTSMQYGYKSVIHKWGFFSAAILLHCDLSPFSNTSRRMALKEEIKNSSPCSPLCFCSLRLCELSRCQASNLHTKADRHFKKGPWDFGVCSNVASHKSGEEGLESSSPSSWKKLHESDFCSDDLCPCRTLLGHCRVTSACW